VGQLDGLLPAGEPGHDALLLVGGTRHLDEAGILGPLVERSHQGVVVRDDVLNPVRDDGTSEVCPDARVEFQEP
jgi:hypothetical protein